MTPLLDWPGRGPALAFAVALFPKVSFVRAMAVLSTVRQCSARVDGSQTMAGFGGSGPRHG